MCVGALVPYIVPPISAVKPVVRFVDIIDSKGHFLGDPRVVHTRAPPRGSIDSFSISSGLPSDWFGSRYGGIAWASVEVEDHGSRTCRLLSLGWGSASCLLYKLREILVSAKALNLSIAERTRGLRSH